VSTPAEQGLDPMLVAEMYYNAAELETIYSLLVIKNGYLIAEDYFNEGSVDQKDRLQSATKSYTSALIWSLSASHRRISSRQRSGNQVPLQQSDVQLAGDHR
jgi:hypothetical protein